MPLTKHDIDTQLSLAMLPFMIHKRFEHVWFAPMRMPISGALPRMRSVIPEPMLEYAIALLEVLRGGTMSREAWHEIDEAMLAAWRRLFEGTEIFPVRVPREGDDPEHFPVRI